MREYTGMNRGGQYARLMPIGVGHGGSYGDISRFVAQSLRKCRR
jgi:hypothetical protein